MTPELGVARFVYVAHAANADNSLQMISTKTAAGQKCC